MDNHIPTYNEELANLNAQIESLTEKRNAIIRDMNRQIVREDFGDIFDKVFEHKNPNNTVSYFVFVDVTQINSSGYAFSCYQFTPCSAESFNVQYYHNLTYPSKERFDEINIPKFGATDAYIKLAGHLTRIKNLNIYDSLF